MSHTDERCKCTMAISLTGDGCRYCQPQEYIDRLHESSEDFGKERDNREDELIECLNFSMEMMEANELHLPKTFKTIENVINNLPCEREDL